VSEKQIITNAALIEQYAQKAMEVEPVEKVIITEAPSNLEVSLPGGFISREGELIRTAEVRELTGADEEAIAKAGSSGKALNVILKRGLVSLGGNLVSAEDLDSLLSGDRDAILLGIRNVTFGTTIEISPTCGSCNEKRSMILDLENDIPTQTMEDPENDRCWEMNIRLGSITVCLPNGRVQKKIVENSDKTLAELNTILIAGCVTSIKGSPTFGPESVLGIGMADREQIISEIVDRNPGPRLMEVVKACEACGADIALPLSHAALFRL
jgi:hypothetical protein